MNASQPAKQNFPAFIRSELDDLRLTPPQFRIYCHICRRGDCFDSIPTMARVCCVNAKTARAALRGLAQAALIEVTLRTGQSTIYKPSPMSQWKRQPLAYNGRGRNATPPKMRGGTPTLKRHTHPSHFRPDKGSPIEGTPPEGKGPPSNADKISLEHELQRLEAQLKHVEDFAVQGPFGPRYNCNEQAERQRLRKRRDEIKQELGWIA